MLIAKCLLPDAVLKLLIFVYDMYDQIINFNMGVNSIYNLLTTRFEFIKIVGQQEFIWGVCLIFIQEIKCFSP